MTEQKIGLPSVESNIISYPLRNKRPNGPRLIPNQFKFAKLTIIVPKVVYHKNARLSRYVPIVTKNDIFRPKALIACTWIVCYHPPFKPPAKYRERLSISFTIGRLMQRSVQPLLPVSPVSVRVSVFVPSEYIIPSCDGTSMQTGAKGIFARP